MAESLLGVDLGAAQVKLAWVCRDGAPIRTALLPTRAEALRSALHLLRELPLAGADVQVGVTGIGRDLWPVSLSSATVNDVAAIVAGLRRVCPAARTVIDIGGQSSKWILLRDGDGAGIADFSTNGACAAGAGVFLDQQASRLGLTVGELSRLAASAPRGATIAGRCSVFAKSDMIHLQQNGTPQDAIAYGLCQALVRTFACSVLQGRRLQPPVVFAGGGALGAGLVRALREQFHLDAAALTVPPEAPYIGALGAAWQASAGRPISFDSLLIELDRHCGRLDVHRGSAPLPLLRGIRPPSEPPKSAMTARAAEVVVGIDVGSVSTDLVALDLDFHVLHGVYLPTRGRPLEALRAGLEEIQRAFDGRVRVLAGGCTGSGRHLAAKIVGADVVRNEITAQAVSAAQYFPDVDTIFEIGGQDSKYISLADGVLAHFEMNKICSGGTGSFLEEQAERLGIRIKDEFAERALAATAPCNLGSRCTVFMDSELVRAQELGVPVEDLCAGLAYSVARNYLEKVVGNHPIGRRVVFQGGTAANNAVVAAFRNLLGCDVAVHPYCGLSGAIGAAILAARAMPARSSFAGFQSCESIAVNTFECRRCENRCQVNRVKTGVRLVHFGDVCERYSERDAETRDRRRPFPELFVERDRLFNAFIESEHQRGDAPQGERMGLLRASLNWEYGPFWAAFLRDLGFSPVMSSRATPEMLERFAGALPSDLCLPVKAAVAQAMALLDSGVVDRLFVPAIVEFPDRGCDTRSHACLFTQELPSILGNLRDPRILATQFVFDDGFVGQVGSSVELAGLLGRSPVAVNRALRSAAARQAQFAKERLRLGERALASDFQRSVVVMGRPYNTYDPLLNLSIAKHLERLGLPAIPADLLPLQGVRLPARWRTLPWRYCRDDIRALRWMRRHPRLFPLMISSFGCGPDAFTLKHLQQLFRGKPFLSLEFDEHRGEGGLVTRLEAFADQMDAFQKGRAPARHSASVTPGPRPSPSGRTFFVPPFSEHARMYAAVLRAEGYPASVLPEANEECLRMGERYCSGRECHPYALIAGDLVRFMRHGAQPGDVFVMPNCAQPCLIRQYGDALRILKSRLGANGPEIWDAASPELGKLVGIGGLARLYEGFLAADVLLALASRLEPYETQRGSTRQLLDAGLAELESALSLRGDGAAALARFATKMWANPRRGNPGDLPVIGLTGDLYTRVNPLGNHNLIDTLESAGCEVWLGPSWAVTSDLATRLDAQRATNGARLGNLALDGLAWVVTERIRRRVTRALPGEICGLVLDPPAADLIRIAQPYVGTATSNLVILAVARLVDFVKRGAAGAISAAGVNCAVGSLIAASIPAIRADYGRAPIISIAYGGSEGATDKLKLETFVEQVKAGYCRAAA